MAMIVSGTTDVLLEPEVINDREKATCRGICSYFQMKIEVANN